MHLIRIALAVLLMAGCGEKKPPAAAAAAPPSVPQPTYDPTRSLAPLIEAVQGAVVAIDVEKEPLADEELPELFRQFLKGLGDPPSLGSGEGSGFVISEDGLVLTNHHVVSGATQITVRLPSGEKASAEVLGSDASIDVALLRLEGEGPWAYVELGSSDSVRVGDWVVAIGNPLGLGHTVTAGIVSAKGRALPGHDSRYGSNDFIQTDAAINEGNSGGPLFDLNGKVIAMNAAIIAGANTVGFAIPIDLVTEVVPDLRDKGRVMRGYLGVRLGLAEGRGAMIDEVYADTPAKLAGLKRGDLVQRVDDQPITSPTELVDAVGLRRPGDPVSLAVERDGKTVAMELTLSERPDEDTSED